MKEFGKSNNEEGNGIEQPDCKFEEQIISKGNGNSHEKSCDCKEDANSIQHTGYHWELGINEVANKTGSKA